MPFSSGYWFNERPVALTHEQQCKLQAIQRRAIRRKKRFARLSK